VTRRRRATWGDDIAQRLRFEREARQRGLRFTAKHVGHPRRLTYRLMIHTPVYDTPRKVTITLPPATAAQPSVRIDGPVCMRHRFGDSSLCMWWAKDPREQRWGVEDGLYALVEQAKEHAYCEARCRNGEDWPKPEAPGAHRERCPTCQSLR
jgi:hypothetical protein